MEKRKRFWKRLCALALALIQTVALLAVVPTTASAAGSQPEKVDAVIFDENFEGETLSIELKSSGNNPLPVCETVKDPVDPNNTVLKITSSDGMVRVVNDGCEDWANYTFECRLYLEREPWESAPAEISWVNVAPFVLANTTDNNPARCAIKYKRTGQEFAYFTSLGSDQFPVKTSNFLERWHTYKFEVNGSNVKVTIDGEQLFDVTSLTSKGTIGFDGIYATYYVDDLKVTRQVSGPVSASVPSGEYAESQDVTLTAAEGESIYYTLDGSDPTENGTLYNAPIHIAGDCTLKAVAVAAGKCYGPVAAFTYTIAAVEPPVVEPLSGRYKDSVEVSMSCSTADAAIYYTIDGAVPTTDSIRYTAPFTVTKNTLVKAIACKSDGTLSAMTVREYVITDELVEARVYVAVDGSDETGDGSQQKPFATIEKARDYVRTINDNMMGDIEIIVGEGRYYIEDAILLTEEDSATNGRLITYKSDGIGKAELIGGRVITGWEKTTSADVAMGLDESLVGKVYKVNLSGTGIEEFNALYVEGEDDSIGYEGNKAIMARYPNYIPQERFPSAREGYLRSAGGGASDIYWQDGTIPQSIIDGMVAAQTRGEEEIAQLYVWDGADWDWFTSTLPMGSIDASTRHLTVVNQHVHDSLSGGLSGVTYCSTHGDRVKYSIGSGARYYLQGNLAMLDVPGEYHYNKATHELYYYPGTGTMDGLTVVAPQTQEIFRLEGSDKTVYNEDGTINMDYWGDWGAEPDFSKEVGSVTIDGFSMMYTEFTNSFSPSWNSSDWYGAMGCFAPEARFSTQPSYDEQTDLTENKVGAITLINTNHITIQNCQIHSTGLWGIASFRDNQYNIVQNCDIGYTGYGAITTDGGYPGVGKYNRYNTYDNIRCHHAGQNIGHAATVTIMNTGYTTFSHLELYFAPRRSLTMLGGYSRGSFDNAYNAYEDIYSWGNHFEDIYIYGGEQDSGEDSTVFFAMLLGKGNGGQDFNIQVPAEKRNYLNQIIIDNTGASPSMHDKNTAHSMEFAMGANGTTISNIMGVNAQSTTIAIYPEQLDGKEIEYENINCDYNGENIMDPNVFDRSKMAFSEIGLTADFPFADEWERNNSTAPEDLWFGDDFESGIVNLRQWTIEAGDPVINCANMAEDPRIGQYCLELHGGNSGAPATLSRTFSEELNKIVEVKYYDRRQDFAVSDKYTGRPETMVRADDGETVVGIMADGYKSTEHYYYVYGDGIFETDVQRCFGWHTFKIDYSDASVGARLYIDDTLVATIPEAKSFNYVAMQSWSTNDRQACYDQFWIYGGKEAADPGEVELPKPPAETALSIEEDFEGDPTIQWVKSGNKKIDYKIVADPENAENHVMEVTCIDGLLYADVENATSLGNYTFEVRMKLKSWEGELDGQEFSDYPWDHFAPIFYAVPADKPAMGRYALKNLKYGNNFALFNGFANGDISTQARPEGYDLTEWHTFKIDMENGTVTVYVDGGTEPVFQYTDNAISGGTIGVQGSDAVFYVDDIKACAKNTAAPTADHESGEYEEAIDVILSVDDATAKIFYTLDGSDPKIDGLYYLGDRPVTVDHACTLKAVAIGAGKRYSEVVSYIYTVLSKEPEADKRALQALVEDAKTLNRKDYTEETWNAFAKALDAAEAVLVKEDATKAEVDAAENALREAIDGLAPRTEKPTYPFLPIIPGGSNTSKPAEEMNYIDVGKTDRYYDDILYVYENGIMNGVGDDKFAPNATLTRAMVVTILYRMEGKPATRYNAMFSDVENYQWYTDGVEWAAKEGIVLGYGNSKFGPNDPVTREQLAAILYRYAQSRNYVLADGADLSAYADASNISSYAVSAVKWSVTESLLEGENGKLLPRENATRAEVAHAIAGFCRNVAK